MQGYPKSESSDYNRAPSPKVAFKGGNASDEQSQPLNPQMMSDNNNSQVKSWNGPPPPPPSLPQQQTTKQQQHNAYYQGGGSTAPPPPMPPPGMSMGGSGGGGGMMQQFSSANQQIWMQRPPEVPAGCPPGLEYLTMVDQILVHQQIELLEVFTNWETKNKYQIKNSAGQQVYYAAEESDVCARQCCGPQRGFVMHITDNMGNEVIRALRDFKCCAGPCCQCCAGIPMCAQELLVESPPGHLIGRIIQQASCLEPWYAIQNSDFETMLHIRGPVCICQGPCCTWDQEFKVYSLDMSAEVGRISKQWSGFVHEYFTDADNFGVSFPLDLDVKMKATMLGAVFLIDFMFFENNQQNQNT